MTLADYDPTTRVSDTHGSHIAALARKALEILAKEKTLAPGSVAEHLDKLCDAFLSDDPSLREKTIQRILSENISSTEIIDHIIPAASRLIGERWVNDEIGFADVTIATMRLQDAARSLMSEGPQGVVDPLGTVLLIIPKGEDHSLGAVIAADQFKRHGYEVDLVVGKHALQIFEMVRQNRYSLVGITAARLKTLAEIKVLVERVRTGVPWRVPIVVGGPIVLTDIDVQGDTGADHVGSDIQQVLSMCNLQSKNKFGIEAEAE